MQLDPYKPGYLAVLKGEAGLAMQAYAWVGSFILTFLIALAFFTVT